MPSFYYCEQRSDEWYRLRLGVATASEFHRIITPTGAYSKSETSHKYMCELIAQRLLGRDEDAMIMPTAYMERGKIMEDSAVQYYEMMHGCQTKAVGFVLSDNGLFGSSPDRTVGDSGLLEIKVPKAGTHVEYALDQTIAKKYRQQVQGQLYVCEREWSDWMSYHPEIRPVIVRTDRDEEYIAKLAAALDDFCASYLDAMAFLVGNGWADKEMLRVLKDPKAELKRELDGWTP